VNDREPNDYVIRVSDDPSDIDAGAWNRLLASQAEPTPFMRHEYLAALHRSASACDSTGWSHRFLTLWSGSALCAAAPVYLKDHSYGEYVFDWAWADAYRRHGLPYYPKLLIAVPFTPVPGSRLLAIDAPSRSALLGAAHAMARDDGLSSAHVLFHDSADAAALAGAQWLARQTVQFHWDWAAAGKPGGFAEFLAGMQRDKRKKITQERRRVADAGVTFAVFEGAQIDEPLWDFFYRCYVLTYRAHRSTPYLTRAFFRVMAETMAQSWVLFVARAGGEAVATSLIAVDPLRRHAYGRYWGTTRFIDCLHFEACYYQPLQWCMANGYRRFEGGAQGEHKMARGLLPVRAHSAHWLAHPAFAQAVDRYLQSETQGIDAYVDELSERDPFRRAP
jgi:predicted N-acyltransferase